MTIAPNPIPAGPALEAERAKNKPSKAPLLPASWNATVLLSPFGDSVSPLETPSQLLIARVECAVGSSSGWMRVGLFSTQALRYCEFVFTTSLDANGRQTNAWYWVDAEPSGKIKDVYGPLKTTLEVPIPPFLAVHGARWGNMYPLMCTDQNSEGIPCDHWVLPSAGTREHGTWFAMRRETGMPCRIVCMDTTNPLMLPILGSFFIANLPTFASGVSKEGSALAAQIDAGTVKSPGAYWNPLVTQQDIHRAMAFPLVDMAPCTVADITAVIPGFVPMRSDEELPQWTDHTYIEGWSLAIDLIPYRTRICYLWTNDDATKHQSVFIGWGPSPGHGTYLQRTDVCLGFAAGTQPGYDWSTQTDGWAFNKICGPPPPVGAPKPDFVSQVQARIMGRVRGNPNFGLAANQSLNFIAGELQRGGGELAIFWLWFQENGTGMLFSEANYLNPLSHILQLIDYSVFIPDAKITQADFANPCPGKEPAREDQVAGVQRAYGHVMKFA